MNWKVILCTGFSLSLLGRATSAPYFGQCRLLEHIAATAERNPLNRSIALELLELVATGQAATIDPIREKQVGLAPGELKEKEFAEPTVMECALRSIGDTGIAEATDFLSGLKATDFAADPTKRLWPAAQVALKTASLSRMADSELRVKFLESTLAERHDAISNSAVTGWAVDQLCDSGALSSLPAVERSIRSRMNGDRDEEDIKFCESRMRVLLRDPDRIRALATVLDPQYAAVDLKLARWAVHQLASVRSDTAYAELRKFASEVGRLNEESLTRRNLAELHQEIREMLTAIAR